MYLDKVALEVLNCAATWEPDARLIGNVTAEDIVELAKDWLNLQEEVSRLRATLTHSVPMVFSSEVRLPHVHIDIDENDEALVDTLVDEAIARTRL